MSDDQKERRRTINAAIAEVLKAARATAGLTQRQLADAIREKHRTYIQWESGDRAPRFEDVKKLSIAFKLSRNTLMNRILDAVDGVNE